MLLQPTFENLLRSLNVHDTIISALRINDNTDRDTFAGLDVSEAGLKTNAKYFGLDFINGEVRPEEGSL